MIDWRPMTEWPPKGRTFRDQFLFWYPATTVGGRMAYSARAVADNAPTGGRTPVAWARIDPPRPAEEVDRERVRGALALLGGAYYLGTQWWGPRHEAIRAAILTVLTGAKVPKSKAGFNAFRTALYTAVGLDGSEGAPNALENEFARRAEALLREVPG